MSYNNKIEIAGECSCFSTHPENIKSALELMPEETTLYDLAEFFKVFGDTTRIKILYILLKSELCVCDIAQSLNMQQSAISHQLRILKHMKLVKFRKEGKSSFYSLDDSHIEKIILLGLEHIVE
jgi:ArsR family transcriptional regulator, lead/cadmium/zinc/bismuth-responsive transcriptional repressor